MTPNTEFDGLRRSDTVCPAARRVRRNLEKTATDQA
jgi:hypothetical protein